MEERMKDLHERIDGITNHFIEMSQSVNRLFQINLEMLKASFDPSLYGEAMVIEDRINAYEVKIMEDSIQAIARFQPTAGDLRELVSFINCIKILERMGDLLKGTLNLLKKLDKIDNGSKKITSMIEKMAVEVMDTFQTYTHAFIERNEKKIYTILAEDDKINEMRMKIIKNIIEYMKENPNNIEGGTLILVLTKKIERLSNKTMQLGKNLVYAVNGKNLRKQELKDFKNHQLKSQ
jgi:phosphate transport system protein